MMTNLFSMFDPVTSECMSLNWLTLFLLLLLIPSSYYMLPSIYYYVHLMLIYNIYMEFCNILKLALNNHMFISLLYMIFMLNFIGLYPYIFTLSSHMVFTVSLALPLWLALMVFGWLNYYNMMFAHLVPQGTPNMLMSFMVLIESISALIRPLTLSVRLCANMIAGHLLLCLIGSLGPKLEVYFIWIVLMIQLALYVLELGVSFIQAYVFSVLCALYTSEVEFNDKIL